VSFPKYPRYKPSGVEWLGEVPEHWHVAPLKRVARQIESGTSVNATDEQAEPGWPGVLKTSCVYTGQFDPREHKRVIPEETTDVSCPVRRGSLIVSRMNTSELVAAAGWVKHEPRDLYLPDRLWQVDIASPDVGFVHYWTLTGGYRSQVEAACTGTSSSMKNLSQDQFLGFTLPCPPSFEAQSITAFLDRETAKIDALIAEQEKLIELLAEKRQAVISHAVTKGLNPAAPMKPSGIEWLGDVPTHWGIVPLRHVADCLDGLRVPLNAEERSLRQGAVPYWGANCVVDLVDVPLVSEPVVLLGEDGAPFFDKAKPVAFFVQVPIWPNNHVHVLRPRAGMLGQQLAAILNITEYAHFIDGSTRDKLTQSAMNCIPATVPPLAEQHAIAAFVDAETTKMDALVVEAAKGIELLRERRSALISAAVTGQIDVRNAVPESAA
jgi:type I restriction enzyme S subunit